MRTFILIDDFTHLNIIFVITLALMLMIQEKLDVYSIATWYRP
ncbi:hypothetical protein SynA15127_01513 [Synechococcus sp. A15-127]|nr:hypothetical protein SynA15127_01513 [Synechococcus sp. A15-127]